MQKRRRDCREAILNLERIQRNHVVITNYEAVRDYEFSFAYCPEGKSLWSIVVTDEAQEYKTPNSKISHAMKALKPDLESLVPALLLRTDCSICGICSTQFSLDC